MRAGDVGSDGKFADAITIFVDTGVSAKFFAQVLVFRAQRADAIVFHFDCERGGFEVSVAFAQVITDHAVHHECAIRVHRCGENLATREIAPFIASDDSAGLEPFEFRRKLRFEFRAMRCFAHDAFRFASTFH